MHAYLFLKPRNLTVGNLLAVFSVWAWFSVTPAITVRSLWTLCTCFSSLYVTFKSLLRVLCTKLKTKVITLLKAGTPEQAMILNPVYNRRKETCIVNNIPTILSQIFFRQNLIWLGRSRTEVWLHVVVGSLSTSNEKFRENWLSEMWGDRNFRHCPFHDTF